MEENLKRLNKIKSALAKISEYPWSFDEAFSTVDGANPRYSIASFDCAGKTPTRVINDGEFVAASPENIAWLVEKLEECWISQVVGESE